MFIEEYFSTTVFPVLTPMAVDSSRPFPLIANKSLNIGALLTRKESSTPGILAPRGTPGPGSSGATDGTSIKWGDANIDGVIDVCDATAVQRHGAGIELLTGDALTLADVNGDNSVDITDVTLIQMYAAGLPVQFPIGSVA